MLPFGGFAISAVSFVIAVFYLVYKLLNWDAFPLGNAPILIGVFFLGGLQMFFYWATWRIYHEYEH